MEQLPYIDEHSIRIGATRERAWSALASVLRVDLGRSVPAPLRMALGLTPTEARGEWRGNVELGDALPGFTVAEAHAPGRLALRGGHRFSDYALIFELDELDAGGCVVRAQTWAAFPGLTGGVYRALVIGSRGHRLIVRRLLRRVAASA
jgi:hypothetical protein